MANFLTSHIAKLPPETRDLLLSSPLSCQALLASLSPLAKQYALRCVFPGEASEASVAGWTSEKKGARTRHAGAIRELNDLGIWTKHGPDGTYRLQESFAAQMRAILETGLTTIWSEPPEPLRPQLPTRSEVKGHASSCWESLLLLLAGEDDAAAAVAEGVAPLALEIGEPIDVLEVLSRVSLLAEGESAVSGGSSGSSTMKTTRSGYRFLLKAPDDQIWTVLDELLRAQYDLHRDEGAAALQFLLQLGFCEEGQVCALQGFAEPELKAVSALSQLGLLYPFRSQDGRHWILPTHLSNLLVCGDKELVESISSSGEGIIVETNYRVYAYTSSVLQRKVLELFVTQEYIMPNLFVGRLTRESCCAAFEAGIDAEAIIDYLRRNVHIEAVKARTHVPTVPETVADSVRLWQEESKRMQMIPAALYESFGSDELFLATVKHAQDLKALIWSNPDKQRVAVDLTMHDAMRTFIKAEKSRRAA